MRYNIMLAGVALTLAASSCSKKFVTLYPEGQLNEAVFYKTNSDFQQAVTGAYVPLRDAANEGNGHGHARRGRHEVVVR